MSKGLYINNDNTYIDNFEQKSAQLGLLGKGGGSEIMIQSIRANEMVIIEPGELEETMEFFYLLEGQLMIDQNNEKFLLKKGDSFYVTHLKERVKFDTITDVKLLYFTTQPVFHYISAKILELTKLAKKVEEKDAYTLGHIDRVKSYAIKIGSKLNLSKEKMESLGFAAIFHDLGKINIPDELLNKPGKLTDEEYELVKKHSTDGAKLVVNTYYENIGDIIEQHHEKVDGSGYPFGLKDEEILIEAKVISVADSYDAMTSDRPYSKGMEPHLALEELLSLRGIHFDVDVVEAFTTVLLEDGLIYR